MNLPQYPVFRELPAPAGKLESFSELNPDCTLAQSQGSAPTTSAASPAVRRMSHWRKANVPPITAPSTRRPAGTRK